MSNSVCVYVCAFVWGQLQPIGQGNKTIMNIQTQPLEGTAAREESHAVTVVQGHFLDLLEKPALQNKRERERERSFYFYHKNINKFPPAPLHKMSSK